MSHVPYLKDISKFEGSPSSGIYADHICVSTSSGSHVQAILLDEVHGGVNLGRLKLHEMELSCAFLKDSASGISA